MRRMYQIQRPRGRAAYSMNQAELSYRAHLYQSVLFELESLYWLDILVPSTRD